MDVEESTWKAGVKHGLCRSITDKEVCVSFFKEGLKVGYFKFGWNFSETERQDSKGFLKDLSPANFKPMPMGFTSILKRVKHKRRRELESSDLATLSVE